MDMDCVQDPLLSLAGAKRRSHDPICLPMFDNLGECSNWLLESIDGKMKGKAKETLDQSGEGDYLSRHVHPVLKNFGPFQEICL